MICSPGIYKNVRTPGFPTGVFFYFYTMENPMEKRIVEFIQEHHVLTLATSRDNLPYCANCFYVYDETGNQLFFTSDMNTKHVEDALAQNQVAGSIMLETKTVGKIRGIQFRGIMEELTGEAYKKARVAYVKKFPYAILKQTALWRVQLTFIKFTDNRLGFGKKIIWEK
jgi:hypothetical protein